MRAIALSWINRFFRSKSDRNGSSVRNMSILITGGTGFLGWYLAKALTERGEEIIAFDVAPLKKYQKISKSDNIKVIRGDLTSWSEIVDLINRYGIEHIFHTGALLSQTAEERHIAAFNVNAVGTFNLLEATRIFDVKKFIFISTLATYGRDFGSIILHESPQRPVSMYGVTKVFGERLGEYYHTRFGIDYRGVRFPSVIGPGRGSGGLSSYTSLIIQEPALGRPYKVYVNRGTRCAFIYVKDAIESLTQLFDADKSKIESRTYMIGGMSPTAEDVVKLVKKLIPEAKIEFDPDPEKDKILQTWPDQFDETRANVEWGWKSRYGFDVTIEDFIKEVQNNKEIYT